VPPLCAQAKKTAIYIFMKLTKPNLKHAWRTFNLECEGSRANHAVRSLGLVKVVRMTGTESFPRYTQVSRLHSAAVRIYGFAKNALSESSASRASVGRSRIPERPFLISHTAMRTARTIRRCLPAGRLEEFPSIKTIRES